MAELGTMKARDAFAANHAATTRSREHHLREEFCDSSKLSQRAANHECFRLKKKRFRTAFPRHQASDSATLSDYLLAVTELQ